jgi:hypothetical protein
MIGDGADKNLAGLRGRSLLFKAIRRSAMVTKKQQFLCPLAETDRISDCPNRIQRILAGSSEDKEQDLKQNARSGLVL